MASEDMNHSTRKRDICEWAYYVRSLCLLLAFVSTVNSHGRLIEPPSRGTMWRYGFDTPPNYNDHELYCGGFSRQWNKNGGKCGICGDAWDMPQPRPHEAGGKYGLGVVVRRYKRNSAINIRIELTANHRGYFEFRLCPNNSPKRVTTQACLDLHTLERADSKGARYYPGEGNRIFEIKYRLPKDLTCSQCVLQWRYIAGNNWGMCPNGTGMVGCGPQEEFRACADVSIVDEQGFSDETEFIDESDNEIPDEDVYNKEESLQEEEAQVFYYLGLIIATCALVFASVVLAVIYLYYYYAKEAIKGILKHSNNNNKEEEKQPHPIPPLRSKKLSPPQAPISVNSISSPTSVTVNGVAIAP